MFRPQSQFLNSFQWTIKTVSLSLFLQEFFSSLQEVIEYLENINNGGSDPNQKNDELPINYNFYDSEFIKNAINFDPKLDPNIPF